MSLRWLSLLLILSIPVLVTGAESKPDTKTKLETKDEQKPTDTKSDNHTLKQPTPPLPGVLVSTEPSTNVKDAKPQKEPEQPGYEWPVILSIGISFCALILSGCALKASYDRNALERPWMMFRPGDPNSGTVPVGQQTPPVIWPLPPMYQGLFVVPWNVINVGRSPAFLTRLVARIEVVDTGSFPPALSRGSEFPNYVISPKIPPDDRFGTNLVRPLTQLESVDIQNGNKRIWVYGAVEYRGFRRRCHTTRFCCIWFVDNNGNNYDPVGPPGWTEYT